MTLIFVHGVPETTAVWAPLVDALDVDDAVLLGLPGFGCALPDAFDATMDEYATWLSSELTRFDTVDLVTHDWGGLLALRVLADRPRNVRSWVDDVGDLDPGFRWHATARTWQTPGDGEIMMEGFVTATDAERAKMLEAVGVPEAHTGEMSRHIDATMGGAILRLYRSATNIGDEWGPGIDHIDAPGLLIESMKDPFRAPRRVRALAERTGAQIAELPECGHFWMLEEPAQVASVLRNFWQSVKVSS